MGGKWGYIDEWGNIAIPLQYEHATPFKNGTAKVISEGKEFNIDKAILYTKSLEIPEE